VEVAGWEAVSELRGGAVVLVAWSWRAGRGSVGRGLKLRITKNLDTTILIVELEMLERQCERLLDLEQEDVCETCWKTTSAGLTYIDNARYIWHTAIRQFKIDGTLVG